MPSNSSSSSRHGAERRNPKWTPNSSWKENLRKECLEKARRSREDRMKSLRCSAGNTMNETSMTLFQQYSQSPPPVENSDNTNDANNNNINTFGYSMEARSLIQATLFSAENNRLTPQQQQKFHNDNASLLLSSSSKVTFETPNPMMEDEQCQQLLCNNGYVYSTPIIGHSWTSDCYLSESELCLLMQEVEEELQQEETNLTRELQAAETQREQEQRYMEEQIAYYESWMDDNNNDHKMNMDDDDDNK